VTVPEGLRTAVPLYPDGLRRGGSPERTAEHSVTEQRATGHSAGPTLSGRVDWTAKSVLPDPFGRESPPLCDAAIRSPVNASASASPTPRSPGGFNDSGLSLDSHEHTTFSPVATPTRATPARALSVSPTGFVVDERESPRLEHTETAPTSTAYQAVLRGGGRDSRNDTSSSCCAECNVEDVAVTCAECEQWFCEECADDVHRRVSFRSHHVVRISSFNTRVFKAPTSRHRETRGHHGVGGGEGGQSHHGVDSGEGGQSHHGVGSGEGGDEGGDGRNTDCADGDVDPTSGFDVMSVSAASHRFRRCSSYSSHSSSRRASVDATVVQAREVARRCVRFADVFCGLQFGFTFFLHHCKSKNVAFFLVHFRICERKFVGVYEIVRLASKCHFISPQRAKILKNVGKSFNLQRFRAIVLFLTAAARDCMVQVEHTHHGLARLARGKRESTNTCKLANFLVVHFFCNELPMRYVQTSFQPDSKTHNPNLI
jgi:hypothetical protein